MIVISKDNDVEVVVTVQNETAYNYYLLQLTNSTSLQSYYKVITPSVSNERAVTFDYLSSDATFAAGQYAYKFYGQNSDTNIDPSLSDELISYGVATVTKTETIEEYYKAPQDKIYQG